MPAAAPISHMTYSDYLATAERSEIKHEYVRGEVFAMSGGTPDHAALAMSVGIALGVGLRGKPCRVFSSDLRIRIEHSDVATYPDVTVVCGQLQRSPVDPNAVINPTVLVEVLSTSTEAWDRGEKAAHYRRIPSLREYLLVAQETPRLELYRRTETGWTFYEAYASESLTLASLGVTLDVDALYWDPLAE